MCLSSRDGLCVCAGQEVLQAMLQDPEATGKHIGSLVDAVVDTRRLQRTVARNDEVSGAPSNATSPALHCCNSL